MIERELTVSNRLGLHARATARLVQVLSAFRANATLAAKGREVNAKSIMGVMLLAAGTATAAVQLQQGVNYKLVLAEQLHRVEHARVRLEYVVPGGGVVLAGDTLAACGRAWYSGGIHRRLPQQRHLRPCLGGPQDMGCYSEQ